MSDVGDRRRTLSGPTDPGLAAAAAPARQAQDAEHQPKRLANAEEEGARAHIELPRSKAEDEKEAEHHSDGIVVIKTLGMLRVALEETG
mmetsp:Transcript_83859/g.232404  ORF Transcript_83859/g.232404 Transcript_83859/m.232404 type:complete len:89 (+) Transcript_83859:484-750(+)